MTDEPVDEIAIDVSRDYCETCGKFTDGETCVACGDEPLRESGVTAEPTTDTVRAGGRCCTRGSSPNPPWFRRALGVPAARVLLVLLFPVRVYEWRTRA
jgi:hypothetical protein